MRITKKLLRQAVYAAERRIREVCEMTPEQRAEELKRKFGQIPNLTTSGDVETVRMLAFDAIETAIPPSWYN